VIALACAARRKVCRVADTWESCQNWVEREEHDLIVKRGSLEAEEGVEQLQLI
jgi:hypothetical protein